MPLPLRVSDFIELTISIDKKKKISFEGKLKIQF